MSYHNFHNKTLYKSYHAKVVGYIHDEYIDFHFNKTQNDSLLIQLSPIDKHYFHLLIGTLSSPKESINNVAGDVVKILQETIIE
jgi:hypothetical protein